MSNDESKNGRQPHPGTVIGLLHDELERRSDIYKAMTVAERHEKIWSPYLELYEGDGSSPIRHLRRGAIDAPDDFAQFFCNLHSDTNEALFPIIPGCEVVGGLDIYPQPIEDRTDEMQLMLDRALDALPDLKYIPAACWHLGLVYGSVQSQRPIQQYLGDDGKPTEERYKDRKVLCKGRYRKNDYLYQEAADELWHEYERECGLPIGYFDSIRPTKKDNQSEESVDDAS